ncbi:PAS domain-containing protein [Spirosoma sp. HMF4905]|uniref:histidine kinase n=1 Tax=Spirosoma arboris TaxID=2682092 RepID=A0A7K1S565_9BACT|nr:ATP-binding protein [Spirosoma arboris]MVM28776.1 PAS domain-containing protein [Spirosoma arboris]
MLIEQSTDVGFAQLLDALPDAVVWMRTVRNEDNEIVNFRIDYANQKSQEMVQGVYRASVGTLLLGDNEQLRRSTEKSFQVMCVVMQTNQPHEYDFFNSHLDSWFLMSRSKLGDGILCVTRDISSLKRAEQANRQQTSLLNSILDSSLNGIMSLSAVRNETGQIVDFTFLSANEASCRMVIKTTDELIGKRLLSVFPDGVKSGLFDLYVQTVETGESTRVEMRYDYDWLDFWIDVSAKKLGDGLVVTFTDVSVQKQLQQKLENSVVDLQRSNKNLEQFAYVASHDLQEPLRKIQAFGDIIRSQYASVVDDGGADMINRMQSAAARMQVLIKDVLAYSRVATIRETLNQVSLSQVVSDVLTDIETIITEKQALVTVDSLPTVLGDSAQLRQLFQNLISNALKFSKSGPTAPAPVITITARLMCGRDVSEINIPANDADRLFHRIAVTDNGIGFDPHQAERIFQVFQRLHNRSEYQGTGIGLAIVQKVVDNHQGYVHAEGHPGLGATFSVLLPAKL